MQISAIILYGINGQKRILTLSIGAVNIITGRSKTGKSAIGDIIDYCFGGSSCNIAEGFVRENVAWYALQLVHNSEYIIIARENPPKGHASTNKCCYLIGTNEIPDNLDKATPVDNDGLEKMLSAKIGISENLFIPPVGRSRPALSANIRHTLYYCLQNQDETASHKVLFHRQSEPFIPQSIKDSLSLFLGITNENSLVLETERTQLKREATILRRSIEEVDLLKGSGLNKAAMLLAEAKEVGLLAGDEQIDLSDYNDVRNALQSVNEHKTVKISTSGLDRISLLQSKVENYQHEIDDICIDIRNTEKFLGQIKGYEAEVDHQSKRLESINLFEQIDFDQNHCPLCSETMGNPLPGAHDIRDSITVLAGKLETVSREYPYLRKHADSLIARRQQLREVIDAAEREIGSIYGENKEAAKLRDQSARRARVAGRISLWLDSVVISDEVDHKRRKLVDIEANIARIDSLLDIAEIEERKQSIMSRLSAMMTKWAKELDLEHSDDPYRFDFNKLTVIVDGERPIPLHQLGSGSNWLGCHLITLFALHTFFRQNNRPIPSFLFIDQPSQVFFPPEANDRDVDSEEVRTVYKFIFKRIKELHPNMQAIIVDHADINEEFFQDAVVEKWWDGTKLVPMDWEEKF